MIRQCKRAGFIAALIGFLLAPLACSDAPTAVEQTGAQDEESGEPSLAQLSADLASAVPLSTAEAGEVNQVLQAHGGRFEQPGFLWYAAEGLQKTLTERQKLRLFRLLDRDPAPMLARMMRQRMVHPLGPLGLIADLLTEEQKASMRQLHQSYRTQVREVLAAVRAGEMTREEGLQEVQSLRESLRAEVEALLTEEQKLALEERRAERFETREEHREAARQAMIDALDLSEEQVEALEALWEAHWDELVELREAFGEGELEWETFTEAVRSLRTDLWEQLAEILSEDQLEIFKIHRVLMGRWEGLRRRLGSGILAGMGG